MCPHVTINRQCTESHKYNSLEVELAHVVEVEKKNNKLFGGHSIAGTKENPCDKNNASKVNPVNATDRGASRVGEKQMVHLKMEIKRPASWPGRF